MCPIVRDSSIPFDLVYGHTSFIPHTGYASHAREFFTRLNKFVPVRIRNFAHTPDLSHLTQEQKDMCILQEWAEPPWKVGTPFNIENYKNIINIILMETNHYYFYDPYVGPKIAYNVWESTRQPRHFFKKLLEFDQFWVPTKWQRDVSIEQGYPKDKIFVVPEGVDGEKFHPGEPPMKIPGWDNGRFKFLLCGRWDYRKGTTEIIRAFLNEFKPDEPVDLICQVENQFPVDGYKNTQERLVGYELVDPRVIIVTGLPESDDLYNSYLRTCDCLVTCARSEGWNLPLIQGIATGIPTICSNWGAQLEFAEGVSAMVNIAELRKPMNVFMQDNTPGLWAEPDWEHLQSVMRDVYTRHSYWKEHAMKMSPIIREKFTWDNAVKIAVDILKEFGSGKMKGEKISVRELEVKKREDQVVEVTKLPPKKEVKAEKANVNVLDILREEGYVVKVKKEGGEIRVEAVKREEEKKGGDVFIIDCYPDKGQRITELISIIEKLKKFNLPIALVSHYPIPDNIQKDVDYVFYDKNNILADNWTLNRWVANEDVKVIGKCKTPYHAAACYSSLYNGVKALNDRFDWAHFVEFDLDADFALYLKEVEKRKQSCKFICFDYPTKHKEGGIITNLMSFDLSYVNDKLPRITSWKEYIDIHKDDVEKTKRIYEATFEMWFRTRLISSGIMKDAYILSNDIREKIIKNLNLVSMIEVDPEQYIYIVETTEGKIVEFTYNRKTAEIEHKIRERREDDVINARFKFRDDRVKCPVWNDADTPEDWKKEEKKDSEESILDDEIHVSFADGCKIEILGDTKDDYRVRFIDKDTQMIIHQGVIKPNHWISPSPRYYVNWRIEIDRNDKPWAEYELDLENSRVVVHLDSKALGDTIAWFPYVQEFKEKHNCKHFYVSTFWNKLFKPEYPDLRFVDPGTFGGEVFYSVGCRDNDYNCNKNNWRLIPLQQVATDYLGLDFHEVRPRIHVTEPDAVPERPYVAISEHSTLLCKRWHYPHAWERIIEYIKSKGLDVMVVSREKTNLKGVIDKTDSTINQTINNIYHSKFFIGVGSGLSWLAWALNKPVILISGFSDPISEMTDCIRITPPEGVCHGCYNDIKHVYDRGNWMWCPRNKKFECSRMIKPEVVMKEIDKLLS